MNSTASSAPCGELRICWATSRRSRTGQHPGLMQSPQTFSRGNFSRSITSVRNPAAAQNAAQVEPAGPPPAIATSTSSIAFQFELSCNRLQHRWRGFKSERDSVYVLVHSDPSHCRHSTADPHHVSFVDCLDCDRLHERGNLCVAPICLRSEEHTS